MSTRIAVSRRIVSAWSTGRRLVGVAVLGIATAALAAGSEPPEVAETLPARVDEGGMVLHTLRSPFQAGDNELAVLTPAVLEPGRRYPVVWVLPVYPGAKAARTGLDEVRRLKLHERFGLICVGPAFAEMPWYADHPSNPLDRQESHLLHAVLPFVESRYPVQRDAAGRLLVGFSKSGWGAFSLLLRHPEIFGRAASWDAPFLLKRPGPWGTDRCWPTEADFSHYKVPELLDQRADLLRSQPARLVLLGYGLYRDDDLRVHAQLANLGVPHHWVHGPERKHTWESGWLEPAIAALVATDMAALPSASENSSP